jgi:hypothetical protein
MRKVRHYAISLFLFGWVGFFGVAAFRLDPRIVALVVLAVPTIALAAYVSRIVGRLSDMVIAWAKRPREPKPPARQAQRTRKPRPLAVRQERTTPGRFVLR